MTTARPRRAHDPYHWASTIAPPLHAGALLEVCPFRETAGPSDNALMSTLLLILLILLILGAFGGGLARPAYRGPGVSVGAILLIILLLWMFGVFGSRPF